MKKMVIIITISMIAMVANVFADDSKHDCGAVARENFKGTQQMYNVIEDKYKNVIPEEAFTKALTNLKTYCCSQKKIICTPEEMDILSKEKLMSPESPYLFDHLIDITMRRLDGIKELTYGLEPDKAGAERRKLITDASKKINGEQAKTIKEDFMAYWTIHKKNTKNLENMQKNYGEVNSSEVSLADKYKTMCSLMKNMYEEIQENKSKNLGGEFENNSFYRKCKHLVDYRVDRESAYVKLIMINQSSQLLNQTTQAYTKKYFVEEKLMGLWKLISSVKDLFQTIVQQAAVSKSCSK